MSKENLSKSLHSQTQNTDAGKADGKAVRSNCRTNWHYSYTGDTVTHFKRLSVGVNIAQGHLLLLTHAIIDFQAMSTAHTV